MSPKARQSKGKARLAAYEKLYNETKAADPGPVEARDHDSRPVDASATR